MLHWSMSWRRCAQEMARLVAPGGKLILGFCEKYPRADVWPEDVLKILRADGLEVVGVGNYQGVQFKRRIVVANRPN